MNVFEVRLLGAQSGAALAGVAAFIGEDASGQFALRAHHERFLTVLLPGLARLRYADGRDEYLAQPGAVVHFVDNRLTLAARSFLRDESFETVSRALAERFAAEDQALHRMHEQLAGLEREMLRRMWRLQREAA